MSYNYHAQRAYAEGIATSNLTELERFDTDINAKLDDLLLLVSERVDFLPLSDDKKDFVKSIADWVSDYRGDGLYAVTEEIERLKDDFPAIAAE